MRDVLPDCVERGITVITNAGGVNPLACKAAVETLADELGVADRVRVGVVLGDDIYDDLDDLIAARRAAGPHGHRPAADRRPGPGPVGQRVPGRGADGQGPRAWAPTSSSAGRVTDTGVTLAPMIHEFGWAADDWDRLAAGIIAGHIIECGTQCTGGNFTDWQQGQELARTSASRWSRRRPTAPSPSPSTPAPAASSPSTR